MRRIIIALALASFTAGAIAEGQVQKCRDCGTVRAVDLMNKGSGEASGGGAVIGAVIGGVVGHQFGSGHGQDAATAAGAVGGAAVGHQAEKQRNSGSYYRVTVDMDNGASRDINVADTGGLAAGSRVRVSGNNLERLN
jgi:outer membrane lipoprotein SlyB